MTYTIPAVKTIYDGIEMDSGLESGFAMWCDQNGLVWVYHPPAFANTHGRWRPDFVVYGIVVPSISDRPRPLYVEVKPSEWPFDGDLERLREMGRRMSAAPAAAYCTPGSMAFWSHDDGYLVSATWSVVDQRVAVVPLIGGPWQGEWWKGVR